MWTHKEGLACPVGKIKPNPDAAKLVLRLLDQEYQSAMCYLCQYHAMPYEEGKQLLISTGAEELSHFELVATLFRKLTKNLAAEDLRQAGLSEYYMDHTLGVAGQRQMPLCSMGDPITDLHQCLLLEQRARTGYDNALRLSGDPNLASALEYLREREIAHYRKFSEMLERVKTCMNGEGCYAYNPAFDLCQLNQSED